MNLVPRGIHSSFPTQSIRLRSGSSFYLRHYLLYYLSMQSFYDCLFHVKIRAYIWVDKMAELKGQYRSRSCSWRSCSFADLSSLYPSYMDLTESCDVWCVNSLIFLCTGFEVIKYSKLNIISSERWCVIILYDYLIVVIIVFDFFIKSYVFSRDINIFKFNLRFNPRSKIKYF